MRDRGMRGALACTGCAGGCERRGRRGYARERPGAGAELQPLAPEGQLSARPEARARAVRAVAASPRAPSSDKCGGSAFREFKKLGSSRARARWWVLEEESAPVKGFSSRWWVLAIRRPLPAKLDARWPIGGINA